MTKISEYPITATSVEDGDLIDITIDLGAGAYASGKISGLTLKTVLKTPSVGSNGDVQKSDGSGGFLGDSNLNFLGQVFKVVGQSYTKAKDATSQLVSWVEDSTGAKIWGFSSDKYATQAEATVEVPTPAAGFVNTVHENGDTFTKNAAGEKEKLNTPTFNSLTNVDITLEAELNRDVPYYDLPSKTYKNTGSAEFDLILGPFLEDSIVADGELADLLQQHYAAYSFIVTNSGAASWTGNLGIVGNTTLFFAAQTIAAGETKRFYVADIDSYDPVADNAIYVETTSSWTNVTLSITHTHNREA